MTKLFKTVIDGLTDTATQVELSTEEIAEIELRAAQAEAEQDAREATEQAKADAKASGIAKLLALGLTEAEAQALVN
jgi:hypothetical protein